MNIFFCPDFDFTSNNQYIASASLDKTVRVWDISRGICIRVIYGVSSQWCIRFHPVSDPFYMEVYAYLYLEKHYPFACYLWTMSLHMITEVTW